MRGDDMIVNEKKICLSNIIYIFSFAIVVSTVFCIQIYRKKQKQWYRQKMEKAEKTTCFTS